MSDKEFPELTIRTGSSGLAIAAVPGKSFNCVEFTLKADYPQDILISPWIQFESVEQSEWRSKWAYEIARRAKVYEELMATVASLQNIDRDLRDEIDKAKKETDEMRELWRNERMKYGLNGDFSDLVTTP